MFFVTSHRALLSVSITLTAAAGCSNDTVVLGEQDYKVVAQLLPEPNPNIDILFVIDNSGSMYDEQESLAQWANEYLFGVLALEVGNLPNLHIGVISSDIGAGPEIASCQANGDNGILQNQPRVEGCTGPIDRYIRDVANPDGTRDRNFSGELAETFGCIAQLGDSGCGFEQPLEAMRRALDGSNPDNEGFLREDALLAVVFVTDEDDCSAFDSRLFSMDQSDPALGPFTSFRCFEHGVECAEDDPRAPGTKTECRATGSDYMSGVEEYIDFLRGLKTHPAMVTVAGIFGDSEPVRVELDPSTGHPLLAASCIGTVNGGQAGPAIRLSRVLDGFPGRSQHASICNDDLAGPLESVASVVGGTAARSPCLLGELMDTEPESEGIQPSCRVYYAANPGTTAESGVVVPECDGGIGSDCYRVVKNAQTCSHTATKLAIEVPEANGQHLVVECRSL